MTDDDYDYILDKIEHGEKLVEWNVSVNSDDESH